MNIFTKLINWLIHLLGGYTEEEMETAENPWYTVAANYRYKYNTEHENYLALLNCHNATAEAAQTALAPVEMAKAIKAYCASRDDCEGCELHETERCKLDAHCPCYWEVDE